jgi:hypothetical protein
MAEHSGQEVEGCVLQHGARESLSVLRLSWQ